MSFPALLRYPTLAWEPKCSASVRKVPVAADLLEMIERRSTGSPYVFLTLAHLDRIRARQSACSWRSTLPLFPSLNRHFTDIQKAAAKAQGDENWRCGCIHDLRKSFATLAAQCGTPMHELQRVMGHASITTTAAFYLQPSDAVADQIRGIFSGVA